MTLHDALDSIVNSSTRDAMKRPSMGGYFFRSAISSAEGTVGDYTLTMRERANDNGNPVDYVYSYDASAGEWTPPATMPDLDGEFFAMLVADDWATGVATDFETARTGAGGEKW